MNPMASNRTTTLAFSARALMMGVNWKSRYSFQGWKVVTRKSYTPAMAVASKSSRACEPPFSPVTSTSVMAVASGYGRTPCMSRTK